MLFLSLPLPTLPLFLNCLPCIPSLPNPRRGPTTDSSLLMARGWGLIDIMGWYWWSLARRAWSSMTSSWRCSEELWMSVGGMWASAAGCEVDNMEVESSAGTRIWMASSCWESVAEWESDEANGSGVVEVDEVDEVRVSMCWWLWPSTEGTWSRTVSWWEVVWESVDARNVLEVWVADKVAEIGEVGEVEAPVSLGRLGVREEERYGGRSNFWGSTGGSMVTSSRVLRGKLPSRLAMNSLSCSRWNSSWRYSNPSKEDENDYENRNEKENKEIKHQEVRFK